MKKKKLDAFLKTLYDKATFNNWQSYQQRRPILIDVTDIIYRNLYY